MEGVTLATSYTTTHKAHYSPPWADMNLVGIAGSSGSGKTSLAIEIIKALDLPWVVLLSMVKPVSTRTWTEEN
jgi:Ni2+-binding GTPase involved in maturation of urease and hydrogenase